MCRIIFMLVEWITVDSTRYVGLHMSLSYICRHVRAVLAWENVVRSG